MAAVTGAIVGAATSIYSANKASKQAKEQAKLGQQAIDAADPFRDFRRPNAEKLNALMNDPSSIVDTPEFKARQLAASRTMAAQGFTGSGNALVEAADAGGQSFQQAFNNLAILSGAATTPGGGFSTAIQGNQAANDNKLSGIIGVGNNLSNLAEQIFNKPVQPKPNSGGG